MTSAWSGKRSPGDGTRGESSVRPLARSSGVLITSLCVAREPHWLRLHSPKRTSVSCRPPAAAHDREFKSRCRPFHPAAAQLLPLRSTSRTYPLTRLSARCHSFIPPEIIRSSHTEMGKVSKGERGAESACRRKPRAITRQAPHGVGVNTSKYTVMVPLQCHLSSAGRPL